MKLRCPAPQVGRRSSSSGRASVTTNSGWLRDHSSRYSTKSSRDASAHCMSSKASTVGYVSASRSKNSRHAANRSCRSRVSCSPRPSSCASRGSTKLALLRRRAGAPRAPLRASRSAASGWLVLGDPAAHPHHVRERPVRDALAVGEAAAAVPVDVCGDPVEVLVELPGQPRLADPGDPRHRDELRPPLVGADVEEVLDLAQLAVAADERRLQALATSARRRAPETTRSARHSCVSPSLPFSSKLPASS